MRLRREKAKLLPVPQSPGGDAGQLGHLADTPGRGLVVDDRTGRAHRSRQLPLSVVRTMSGGAGAPGVAAVGSLSPWTYRVPRVQDAAAAMRQATMAESKAAWRPWRKG